MSNVSIPATLIAISNTEAHINEMLARDVIPTKELDFEYDYLATMQTTLKIAERKVEKKQNRKNFFRK